MKHLLLTTIAAVVLVGCGTTQQLAPPPETKPEPPTAKALGLSLQAQTSENSPRLKTALEKYPAADANKDGLLTLAEARAFKKRQLLAARDLPEGFTRVEMSVDGVAREFLVYAPPSAKQEPTPVVFAFHGRSGSGANIVRKYSFQRHWPAAISVYMQGLNKPGRLTDHEDKKSGWQNKPGDQNDRDLKFFDAVVKQLKADYEVDEKRIYSTGHSTAGAFTYLLWAARGDVLAAVAPSASAASAPAHSSSLLAMMKPKPAMHIAGEADPLVKYKWQATAMTAVRKLNGCAPEGKPWHKEPKCLIYESETGMPFVSVIHPGGYRFFADAPALIVKFFQEH